MRVAAGLQETLAQVNQMALRLQLARPAQVGLRDARAGKWIVSDDGDVVGDDFAVLDGEDVERSLELVPREEQRDGEAGAAPSMDRWRAGGEIGESDLVHERERVKQLIGSGEAVRDQRVEALTEHTLQIGCERAGRRLLGCAHRIRSVHPFIITPRTELTERAEKIHKRRNGVNGGETEKTGGLAPRNARRRGSDRASRHEHPMEITGARVCCPVTPPRSRPRVGTRAPASRRPRMINRLLRFVSVASVSPFVNSVSSVPSPD